MMAGVNEAPAPCYRQKYQLPNDASVTPQNIGPDVAAEIAMNNGAEAENWTRRRTETA